MAGLFDNYNPDIYNASSYAGGSLSDYFGSDRGPQGQPFAPKTLWDNPAYVQYIRGLQASGAQVPSTPTNVDAIDVPNPNFVPGSGQSPIMRFDAPHQGRVQQKANSAYNKGYEALAAQNALYPAMLASTRRSVADYGDLWRRAANDQLAFQVSSDATKRAADIQDYLTMGPQLLAARRSADPLFAQSYDLASQDLQDVNAPLPPNVSRDIAEAVRSEQASRGMGLGGSDAFQGALAQVLGGEQFRNQRRQQAFGEASSLLGQYGDPFQSITGRTAHTAPAGSNVMAPSSDVPVEDFMSYLVNQGIQDQNVSAADRANTLALYGNIIKGVGSLAGGAICWVAREVYGEENPRWRKFRAWLVCHAPLPHLRKYLRHGPRFAAWLKRHPEHKPRVRAWMESKLKPA